MNEFVSKFADVPTVAAPSAHWRRGTLESVAQAPAAPRVGHSFAGVGVRQSSAPRVQAKLAVSHPGDSAEHEADRVADAVMQMPEEDEEVARMPEEDEEVARMPEEDEEVSRMPEEPEEDVEDVARVPEEEEEEEEGALQARSEAGGVPRVTPALESEIRGMHGGGQPLAKDTRDFFEPRLGADLSQVRVHTGDQAAGVSRKLQARAFTVGSDITFGAGQYRPASSEGKRLIAHELTHVIQQQGRTPRPGEDNRE